MRYPEVNFIATDRNASAWSGRKNPYIADLLLALMDAREPVLGLINSDIVFQPAAAWGARLPSVVRDALVVGQRYDATSLLNGSFQPFRGGIDCFFFDRNLARGALEQAMPFAIGLPWWDCWLPCIAAFNDRDIIAVERPHLVHLVHQQTYTMVDMLDFAHSFANFVIEEYERRPRASPELISEIVPGCREVAALRRGQMDTREFHLRMGNVTSSLLARIRKSTVSLESDELPALDPTANENVQSRSPSAALSHKNVFRRFDRRASAGIALGRAKKLLDENKLVEAEPELLAQWTRRLRTSTYY